MNIPISEAKGQLTELVRRAEAGDDVVLTRHGQAAVRLVPVRKAVDRKARAAALKAVWDAAGKRKKSPGPSAARSQDYLYDKFGLPK